MQVLRLGSALLPSIARNPALGPFLTSQDGGGELDHRLDGDAPQDRLDQEHDHPEDHQSVNPPTWSTLSPPFTRWYSKIGDRQNTPSSS